MPKLPHEMPGEVIGKDPESLPELLSTVFDLPLPKFARVKAEPGELKMEAPVEYRADQVVLGYADPADERPAHALIFEHQLREDKRKLFTWPMYVAGLRAKHECGATLVVFCADVKTAEWAATTIDMGHPRWLFRPLVIGPDRMPVITDPDTATRYPALGVLSALHHAGDLERGDDVCRAMLSGMDNVQEETAEYCIDALLQLLPEGVAAHLMEMIMTDITIPKHYRRFTEAYEARGEIKGEAKALLKVLAARGFEVPEEIRQTVMACTDIELLDTWLRRAGRAEKLAEVFD